MKRTSLVLALFLLTPLLLAASGCALIGGGEHLFGDASMSDAAAAVAGDSTKKVRRGEAPPQTTVPDVGYTVPPATSGVETTQSLEGGGVVVETSDSGSGPGGDGSMFGVVFGLGSLGGTTYDGYVGLGLDIGMFISSRMRVDIVGAANSVNFTDQSVAGEAFKNEFELSLEANGRYYLTPQHTLMGLYPIAGFRFGTLFWDFARPITVIENGQPKQIAYDQMNYVSFYGGAGLSLMQIRHTHVGLNLTGGIKIYDDQTKEGFSNDLLPAAGFFQTTIEATYKF